MVQTPSIAALIRDNKTFRIPSDQQTGAKFGMRTLDQGLLDWYRKGRIAREEVINRCLDPQAILAKIAEVDAEIEAEVDDDEE